MTIIAATGAVRDDRARDRGGAIFIAYLSPVVVVVVGVVDVRGVVGVIIIVIIIIIIIARAGSIDRVFAPHSRALCVVVRTLPARTATDRRVVVVVGAVRGVTAGRALTAARMVIVVVSFVAHAASASAGPRPRGLGRT